MTDSEIVKNDLRLLLAVVTSGTPLLIQASGGPTLTIHDQAVAARVVAVLMDHLEAPKP